MKVLYPDEVIGNLHQHESSSGHELLRSFTPTPLVNWKHPEHVEQLLVIFPHLLGDQLWGTALIHQIKRLHPETQIDIATGNPDLWWTNKDIRGTKRLPLPELALECYDGILNIEDLTESETNKDVNCYQSLFDFAGIPFAPAYAVPHMPITWEDSWAAYCNLLPNRDGRITPTLNHIVVGLHTSCQSRNPRPAMLIQLIADILPKFLPGATIYAVSSNDFGGSIQDYLTSMNLPHYVNCHKKVGIRNLAALCRDAALVIAPDSMLIHLAAAYNAPTVALMSTVEPEVRTSTYEFCEAIWNKEACQYAACHHRRDRFFFQLHETIEIAPCYTPNRTMCDVMTAIQPQQILSAATRVMQKRIAFDNFNRPPLPL